MAVLDRVPDPIGPMLEWLEAEPGDDPVADLAVLRSHLARLSEPGISGSRLPQCIGLFDGRVLDISGRLRSCLFGGGLPLPRAAHQPAVDLVEALLRIAAEYLRLVDDVRSRWARTQRPASEALAARALHLVSEGFLVGCMTGMAAPFGLWQCAHTLIAAARRFDDAEAAEKEGRSSAAVREYKRLLAMAAIQPESLTARELTWIFDYFGEAAAMADLSGNPILPEAATYWIDPAQDSPPVATIRRAPPAVDGLFHFSAQALGRRLGEWIEWLELRLSEAKAGPLGREGGFLDPEQCDLPLGLAPAEALSLLRRVRERCTNPPRREQPRRHQQYTVQVCVGLKAIWDRVREGEAAGRIDEWVVYNESPGGYAIMSVAGTAAGLGAGMVLALRRDADHPWSICLVRWIRSETPDQVELGLQVVSRTCTPVLVAFRGGDAAAPAPALTLPPMAAVRHNQAILAPAGIYTARRFCIVHESERLYVAQGRVLSLDMQTASVELFQYEIDPYPI